jgi:hypothetical protein
VLILVALSSQQLSPLAQILAVLSLRARIDLVTAVQAAYARFYSWCCWAVGNRFGLTWAVGFTEPSH